MKILFGIFNAFFISLILIGDICYTIFGGLWLKGLTSSMFVLLGMINLLYLLLTDSKHFLFGLFMLIGLTFSMIGDIVLNLNFMIGAIIFAIGHVFYFVAYCLLKKFKWTDLIATAIIFVPSCLTIVLTPIFNFGGALMEIVCVLYALIISLMLGKAISNLIRERNLLNLLIVIGSFLFFFSDLMLLFDVFANVSIIFDILCLATYYPAQAILGHSLMYARDIKTGDVEIKATEE